MGNPRRVSLRCEPQVCIPQAKLKEIIARLDARCNGGFSMAGRTPAAGQGGSDEDEDRQPWVSSSGKAGGVPSSGTAAAVGMHRDAPTRLARRQTVLLSATLHQDLGDLAAAILSDPVPVGFAVQSLVSEEGVILRTGRHCLKLYNLTFFS